MTESLHIAVVGDVHLLWTEADTRWFNTSSYDYVLFVGDIARYRHRAGVDAARIIGGVSRPTFLIPGNHDATHLGQLVAEVLDASRLSTWLGGGQNRRAQEFQRALGSIYLAGYSVHPLSGRLAMIAARPHSMGGHRLSFPRFLSERFGIATMDQSIELLCQLVDRCEQPELIFLAHNGPSGLGSRRGDIWGCDFRRSEGDFGDPDLRAAIDYARSQGKRVRAVIAGHMHHALKGGGQRAWTVLRNDTLYVNAARVPRIFRQDGEIVRHHVALHISPSEVTATEQLVAI